MVKRVTSRKRPSDSVQGEGSFVVLTGLKVREMKEQQALGETEKRAIRAYTVAKRKHDKLQAEDETLEDYPEYESEFDNLKIGIDSLKVHVRSWNWEDDDGNPLPQPQEDPNVFDELTDTEITFLLNEMMGVEESKN